MQNEREAPVPDEIVELFRDLGLEDSEVQDHFRQLAKPTDWHTWREQPSEPQDTQNNTIEERKEKDAQLESAS